MFSISATTDSHHERLRAFTIALNREVCIRNKSFGPATTQEHIWASDGPCAPKDLVTVKEFCK